MSVAILIGPYKVFSGDESITVINNLKESIKKASAL